MKKIFALSFLLFLAVVAPLYLTTKWSSSTHKEPNSVSKSLINVSPRPTFISAPLKYHNDEFGFGFNYNPEDYGKQFTEISPKRNINETGTIELGLDIYLFDNYSRFNWFMNNGAFYEKVKYDKTLNKWVVSLENTNVTKDDFYCPSEVETKNQNVPYYVIGDSRSGRANDYAFVTKKGIVVIRESYPSETSKNIIFDNTGDVIKVKLNTCIEN